MTKIVKASKITLNAEQHKEIVARINNKETKASLAREYGVSARTIGRIYDASKVVEIELKEMPKDVAAEINKNIKLELARIAFANSFHAENESKFTKHTPKRVVIADYSEKHERAARIAKRKADKMNQKFKKPVKVGILGDALKKAGV